jgi:hypothetical protein
MFGSLGYRWGYTFLLTDSGLSEKERMGLVMQATEMYLSGERERRLKEENFEGVLYTERKFDVLGSFAGQRFEADLDSNYGNTHLRFLVNEQTAAAYSGN